MTAACHPAPNRERLIEDYGQLCTRATRKFMRPGLDKADLQQIAAIGLIKACDRYDPRAATPFEAFAWLFIIGELMHFVRDHERLVRAPRQLRRLEKRVQGAQDTLVPLLCREPSIKEIAAHLSITPREVGDVYMYREQALAESLDEPQGRAVDVCVCDDIAETNLAIHDALAGLNHVERTIVVGLYAGGYSQLELAERLGYSRRHISRLHRRALRKMRSAVAI